MFSETINVRRRGLKRGWPTYICRDLEGGIGDVHRGFGCGVECHPIEKHCSGIDTGVLIGYPGEIRFPTDPPFRYVFVIVLHVTLN